MFTVHIGSLVSLNESKEYSNAPLHSAAYKADLKAGALGKVVGIPYDHDTYYIAMRNGRNQIIVAKRAEFSVVKE